VFVGLTADGYQGDLAIGRPSGREALSGDRVVVRS